MMFGRDNRFPPLKPSDIPGPNAYNIQDPEYDAYKRGAFLEKADRFSKEKPSDVPGPNLHSSDSKTTTSSGNRSSSGDRAAMLQRKVDELERLLSENKKSHHAELERLKLELNRTQKINTEQSERNDKLKKQNDAQDFRMKELKRATETGQSEIKDLRAKLRVSEYERGQVVLKQNEAGEAKKALQALDSKRRDEIRERDRKIAELEKAVGGERKKRESLEGRLSEVKGKMDAEIQEAKIAADSLQMQLHEVKADADRVKTSLAAVQSKAADDEEDLLTKLEQHRIILSRVAEEYGRLASCTVSKSAHEQVKREALSSQLRIFRLERKLSNTEGQVVELAHLIRPTKEENQFLSARLRELEEERNILSTFLKEATSDDGVMFLLRQSSSLYEAMSNIERDLQNSQLQVQSFLATDMAVWSDFFRLRNDELLLHTSSLLKTLDEQDSKLRHQSEQLSTAESKHTELSDSLAALQSEHEGVQRELNEVTSSLAGARGEAEVLKKRLEDTRTEMRTEITKMEQTVTQEKEANQRLANIVRTSKVAEDSLQVEVEQLTSDLAEAERYQEAYTNLVDEVGALVQRNALAQEEAERLSKFNAEILGHHNPAQRIMYVDRVRRELHEMKEQLFIATRDRNAVLDENDDLRHELGMYKSVAVHPEHKPRTVVTRVGRIPLSNQNQNLNVKPTVFTTSGIKRLESTPELEYREGDMTMDEIM